VGTLTYGRQNGLLADGVAKYDPLTASNAFSVIGFSGAAAGGGNTENRRLDSSLKYVGKYGPVRAGAQYQLNGSTGSAGSAWELELGFDFAGASLDAFYMNKKDDIGTAALSAAQMASLTTPGNPAFGYSSSNTLAATISDTTTYSLMGQYNFGKPKISFGYEHIEFANPSTPLATGAVTIGGYI